jgi:hypothetical protein
LTNPAPGARGAEKRRSLTYFQITAKGQWNDTFSWRRVILQDLETVTVA